MSKRKPSKFRRAKREQRARAKAITVDIETRSAADIGTRVHREIEHIIGHYHVGPKSLRVEQHDQLMAYAHMAGLGEVVILTGGDLIHEPVLHTDLVPYDLTKAEKAVKGFGEVIRRAMKKVGV